MKEFTLLDQRTFTKLLKQLLGHDYELAIGYGGEVTWIVRKEVADEPYLWCFTRQVERLIYVASLPNCYWDETPPERIGVKEFSKDGHVRDVLDQLGKMFGIEFIIRIEPKC